MALVRRRMACNSDHGSPHMREKGLSSMISWKIYLWLSLGLLL